MPDELDDTWCWGLSPDEFPGGSKHDDLVGPVRSVVSVPRSLEPGDTWPLCAACYEAWKRALYETATARLASRHGPS